MNLKPNKHKIIFFNTTTSVHPPPPTSFCRGEGVGVEPPTKFPKRGGLTRPQLLKGVAGKEGGGRVTFSGWGEFHFSHTKK